jgi:predicted DNA-binding transcriptional regulator AlpA
MPRSIMDDHLLSTRQLRELGIRFSRQWISKLIARGDFPAGILIGEKTKCFWASDIDAWLVKRTGGADAG